MCALGEELNQCLARGMEGKLQAGPACVLAVCQGCRAGERRGRRANERGGRVGNRVVASLTVLLSDGQSWFVLWSSAAQSGNRDAHNRLANQQGVPER